MIQSNIIALFISREIVIIVVRNEGKFTTENRSPVLERLRMAISIELVQ